MNPTLSLTYFSTRLPLKFKAGRTAYREKPRSYGHYLVQMRRVIWRSLQSGQFYERLEDRETRREENGSGYEAAQVHNTHAVDAKGPDAAIPEDSVAPVSGHLTITTSDIVLRRHVLDLPVELQLEIRDTLFRMVFGPKKIHPQSEPLNLHIFEALNHQLYEK